MKKNLQNVWIMENSAGKILIKHANLSIFAYAFTSGLFCSKNRIFSNGILRQSRIFSSQSYSVLRRFISQCISLGMREIELDLWNILPEYQIILARYVYSEVLICWNRRLMQIMVTKCISLKWYIKFNLSIIIFLYIIFRKTNFQCPCIGDIQSGCMQYDSRFQAMTLDEAIVAFPDLTQDQDALQPNTIEVVLKRIFKYFF